MVRVSASARATSSTIRKKPGIDLLDELWIEAFFALAISLASDHNVSMLADIMHTPTALMADASRRMRYTFDARTRSLGVTGPQWRMLMLLARLDGPTQSDLADYLDVERITLCRMVDRLVESGMVERRADPADRRVWRIYLTEKAMPLVAQLTAIARELEDEILQVVTPEERTVLVEVLGRIRDRLRAMDDIQKDTAKVGGSVK